jgi:hypothetical protein
MLSGKAFVPGMGIESSCGGIARPEKPRPTIKTTNSSEHHNFIRHPAAFLARELQRFLVSNYT